MPLPIWKYSQLTNDKELMSLYWYKYGKHSLTVESTDENMKTLMKLRIHNFNNYYNNDSSKY